MPPGGVTRHPIGLAAWTGLVLLVTLVSLHGAGLLQETSPVRTSAVGRAPAPVVVDARTRRVFVANLGSNTVSMLDADSGAVLATIAVAPTPARWPSPRPRGASLPSPTMSPGMMPAA